LSSKNVDSAVILNTKGKVCAVLNSNIVAPFWYECNKKGNSIEKQKSEIIDNPIEKLSILNISNMNKLNERSEKKTGDKLIGETCKLIEKSQKDYKNGLYEVPDFNLINMDCFSLLDRPLKYCESMGKC
jgi:hypothetical protein